MPDPLEIHQTFAVGSEHGPRRWTSRPHRIGVLVLLAAAFGLAVLGCASSSGSSRSDAAPAASDTSAPDPLTEVEITSDGLHLARATPHSKLWVRPNHHMGRYDDVLVDGIAFAYARGQERLEPDQEKRIGEILVEAVNGITADSPVGQARAPGECVVALELALKDLRFHVSESQGSTVSFVSSFGDATMIVEFRDSTTRTPLLRYAAHRGLGSGPATGRVGADLNRLGRALGEMVTDMMTELQTAVPSTTERPATTCNDGIYRLTGRG
jgi:hypothetical protein